MTVKCVGTHGCAGRWHVGSWYLVLRGGWGVWRSEKWVKTSGVNDKADTGVGPPVP